jgi:hypothetical protein
MLGGNAVVSFVLALKNDEDKKVKINEGFDPNSLFTQSSAG